MTRVLVIDDPVIHEMAPVLNGLSDHGNECKIVGEKDDIEEHIRTFKPQLVFIHACNKGFELCKKLKTNPMTCFLKIVMFTEARNMEDIVEGFCLGATDYIPINTSPKEIMSHIEFKTSIESMYEKLRDYSSILQSIAATNKSRTSIF